MRVEIQTDDEKKEVVAVYIRIKEGEVARTEEIGEENFIDLDKEGCLVGVEILNFEEAPKLLSSLADKFHLPALKEIVCEEITKIFATSKT
jgi:uncharacterized protein YuzE